jgi:arylsulfotransferase ASST
MKFGIMHRVVVILFVLLCNSRKGISQVFPEEGSSLHYRLIGFCLPATDKSVNRYDLEIAAGNYSSDDSFRRNIIVTKQNNNGKIIGEVPAFGSNYTWRAVYYLKNTQVGKSKLFHFSTKTCPNVDTCVFRLRVLKNTGKYDSAYVFIDDNKTLYDMRGNPVWYLPDIAGISITPRDLKLSPQGTITFLFDPPYEINYNGNVLWKGPNTGQVSGDLSEHYHHEFTRLANGYYMVLGMDSFLWKHPAPLPKNAGAPTSALSSPKSGAADSTYRKMGFGTLIEYDEKGHAVWWWKSSGYFDTSDLCYYISPNDAPNIDVHENAFFFDEKNNSIYVSFKNISRIVKIKYPEGIVTNAYGPKYRQGDPQLENGLFCGQHACKYSENGYLYLYNNNVCDSDALPKVEILKEPPPGKDIPEKIWEYECTIDGVTGKDKKKYRFISGGNVEQLRDHSIFVCMSGIYGKLFVVDMDKEETWSALPERWNTTEKKWNVIGQYRASMISGPMEMERLIWNSEQTK